MDMSLPKQNLSLHIVKNTTDFEKQSATQNLPENCRIIENDTKILWDHPGNLVSWQTEELVYKVCGGILIPSLFLLGTPANILNMVVFYKQGLKERINVCLFCLALVDILHLTPVFIFEVEQVASWFSYYKVRTGKIYQYVLNNNLLGFAGFGYGSMLLAAVISTERCVCVLFPLRAQRCVPTRLFTGIVVCSVFTISLLRFVVTAQNQSSCFYEVRTRRKSYQYVLNDYYYRNRAMLSILEGVFFGIFLSFGCPALVLITTIITAVKLRRIVRWRSSTSSVMSRPKEIALTKMLICLSVEFILLSCPLILVRVTRLFPAVLSFANHTNLYRILVNIYGVCFYVSSAVNFVVYYVTGTKYRETLHAVLGIRKRGKIRGGPHTPSLPETSQG